MERFLKFLLEDEESVLTSSGRVVDRRAEFRAESAADRSKRLWPFRRKKEKGQLSPEEREILGGLERTSSLGNKFLCIWRQKPADKKAQGNVPESKRLYVAELVARQLYPENHYEFLHTRLEPHAERPECSKFVPKCGYWLHPETVQPVAESRAVEMRIRRFEKEWIASGTLTCQGVVEEQFEWFKSQSVLSDVCALPNLHRSEPIGNINPFWAAKFAPNLLSAASPMQPAQRMAWMKVQSARIAFSDSERALLSSLCE